MFHADPNPGNYVCMPDGRMGLIDFGCVRECTAEEWELMKLGYEGYRHGGEVLRDAIQRSTLLTDEELEEEGRYELMESSCQWLWEPMRIDAPFDFGDEAHLQRGLDIVIELIRQGYTKTHPVFTWMNRTFYGIRALGLLLEARVNLGRINAEEVERAGI